ncbi:hypothetical protein D3C87_1967830 [compost metagenome]
MRGISCRLQMSVLGIARNQVYIARVKIGAAEEFAPHEGGKRVGMIATKPAIFIEVEGSDLAE